ncbi:amidohydrolase 3 [Paraphaeosphaeria sporulosa]|uniref:Amidohydrolase 3 n=1 Tax=Paraphaeosphaeria sporulosa TaxID=1460663 RepID=A0A177CFN2_9PLEO|nr:amidohydrolase 3 [Paraphaeosphaeria sporulosa]OAG05598.1 amidohydrolase 3 [Paraphaeosphaeria sporulosa]
MAPKIFTNARVFANSSAQQREIDFCNCMVIQDGNVIHVGSEHDTTVRDLLDSGAEVTDLKQQLFVPGLIDAHTHLLFFGLSRQKLDLTNCASLDEVRAAISDYGKRNPDAPRILCRGWQQPSTGRLALATMLDDLDPRPIYVEALDLHSSWVNTAALRELPLENAKELGPHQVVCGEDGRPSGLFAEAGQVDIIWSFLNAQYTTEEKQDALDKTFKAYIAAGYTGAIDMAMDDNAWDALKLYRERKGALPIHIAAHWLITPPGSGGSLEEKVDVAIARMREWPPSTCPEFCIIGIKLICDGVVDGCTAALRHPYTGHVDIVQPLWPADAMNEVVHRATQAGLQVAIHAIGDAAVTQAINAIASANTPGGRHRIEHLELTTPEDAQRLGQLGITASVQPVHSDPAILHDYQKLVGAQTFARAFAYKDFLDGGACVALGTDAPTAVHLPLPNLYNATTRRSATQPEMEARTTPHQALTLTQAFHAATTGAARSRFAEGWTGRLEKGLWADFVVLECEWEAGRLLEARLEQTWARGKRLFPTEVEQA